MAEAKRALLAILAADVAGYSRLMGDNERATMDMLDVCRDVFRKHTSDHGGRVVDTAGDSVLATFPSVVEAVDCAVDVQSELVKCNADLPGNRQMLFRIGVNLGDVFEQIDGTIYGDGVNVAARLESLAEPGGITVSESAFMQVEGKSDLSLHDIGEHEVKNIARPVRAYRVVADKQAAQVASSEVGAIFVRPSIAVLPFDNLSRDPEQEYFADGIAEDLITALSRIRWLSVTARNSTFTYKVGAVDVKQVGRELGVRYVLEGSVRKSGNRIRVTAQLIDAVSGNHVWAGRYDRELMDLFDLQDEITETIAGTIEPELGAFERALSRNKPPENLDAWDCYQRGLGHLWHFEKNENEDAKRMFRRAIELDEGFAAPYSGLAYASLLDASMAFTGARDEALESAIGSARKAIELDDRDAFPHCVLGRAYIYSAQVEAGISELEIAIELNPSFAMAHYGLGNAFVWIGRAEEAVAALDRAVRLSPHDPYLAIWETNKAMALSLSGDDSEALVWARRATQHSNTGFWAYFSLALVLGHLSRYEEARAAVANLLEMEPEFSVTWLEPHALFAEPSAFDHYVEGLRKAGLDIPVEPSSAK